MSEVQQFVEDLRNSGDHAPMVRWWWFGPTVDRAGIDDELHRIRAMGYSGVEAAFVYPMDEATCQFLDQEFLDLLAHAVDTAADLGLKFDLTLGSGWPFGGPHIGPDQASKGLVWERRDIPPGEQWREQDLHGDVLAAFIADGTEHDLPREFEPLDITSRPLRLASSRGPRELLVARARPTGQTVKRAAVGAEGAVLDHYCAGAVRHHLDTVGATLVEAVDTDHIRYLFCDSLEVYGADWSPGVPAHFEQMWGYDPLPKLWMLQVDGDGSDTFRQHYYATLTSLVETNFIEQCSRWCEERGLRFRIQSYGVPPVSVSSYRAAHLFEGEGWGWLRFTESKWAAAAANVLGRADVSSEIWTWVHSPSFRAVPLDIIGELHEHVLSGINEFVGHGWPYHAGAHHNVFYASGALDERNPWSPVLPAMNRYAGRLSRAMKHGLRATSAHVLVPERKVTQQLRVASGTNRWKETSRLLGDLPRDLRAHHHDYDVVDRQAIEHLTSAARTGKLIVVHPGYLDETESHALEAWTEAGGEVILAEEADRGAIPRRLGEPLLGIRGPVPGATGVVRRDAEFGEVYFVCNVTGTTQHLAINLLKHRARLAVIQCLDGRLTHTLDGSQGLEVELEGHQGLLLVATDDEAPAPARPTATTETCGEDLLRWRVITADGSEGGVEFPHHWNDDERIAALSTSVTYHADLTAEQLGGRWILDFGQGRAHSTHQSRQAVATGPSFRADMTPPVGHAATVVVNGQEAGEVFAPPFSVDVTEHLQEGTNSLEVTVYSAGSPAFFDGFATGKLPELPLLEQRYGRRFTVQDIDRSGEGVDPGLFRAPSLRRIAGT